ncbi:unnamed protein product, partial [Chrysoparadoxa australica]
ANGNRVPKQTLVIDGIRVGRSVSNLRKKRKNDSLSEMEEAWLEEHGMVWDAREHSWNVRYDLFSELSVDEDGFRICLRNNKEGEILLGKWVNDQRRDQKNKRLRKDRKKLLDEAKMKWEVNPSPIIIEDNERKEVLLAHRRNGPTISVSAVHKFADGRVWKIGVWFHNRKREYR